jgi:ABC-type Fe3+ transport system substrate-binding protein
MTILLMTYDFYGRTSGLQAGDILGNEEFRVWFSDLERTITQFEYSTGPLMEKMVAYGPSMYDLIAVYEATAIEQAENAIGRYGELRVFYPPATIWSDHPFCILDAEWVSEAQRQAGQAFIAHLLSFPMQEAAMLEHGFRPVDPAVALDQPGSPFTVYAANGLRSDLSQLPVVEVPEGGVLNSLLEFWSRYGQR